MRWEDDAVLLRHNLFSPLVLRSVAERDASRRTEATAGPSWFSERCHRVARTRARWQAPHRPETARHDQSCVGMARTRASSPRGFSDAL